MSRKTLLTVFAVLGAIAVLFTQTFGLSADFGATIAGLGAILVYIFFEAKADIARIAGQIGRFKDPKFWVTVISAILAALGTSGINLPISPELIISILTAIVALLFKRQQSNFF